LVAKGLRGMGGWLGILVPTHADDEACRHGWGTRPEIINQIRFFLTRLQ